MKPVLYYVGTPEEVAHHARPLGEAFDLRLVAAADAARHAQAGDVCVFFNEYFPRFRDACLELKAKNCATLYAVDGILEWRNSWELPENGNCCLWVMRPVLSDKIACIGRSQARVLESWGNLGKCEVVGVPRFDALAGRQPRQRREGQRLRILVITAKCPGFTPAQVECTTRSLVDLKIWFDAHPHVAGMPLEPVWRITQGLEQAIGVENKLSDTTGKDLASVLAEVDAVISTPSTAMLEGMLQGLPVALLDYHNRPHYVPAAWTITAPNHFDEVISQLAAPPASRQLYQDSILHDALECHSPATSRLVQLISEMGRLARQCVQAGRPLAFPRRILPDPQAGHHLPEPNYDHSSLFPARVLFTGAGRPLSRTEAMVLAEREGFTLPDSPRSSQVEADLDEWLSQLQHSTRQWRNVPEQIAAEWEVEKARACEAVQRELSLAKRELRELKRKQLGSKLGRLAGKVRKLLQFSAKEPPADQQDKAA